MGVCPLASEHESSKPLGALAQHSAEHVAEHAVEESEAHGLDAEEELDAQDEEEWRALQALVADPSEDGGVVHEVEKRDGELSLEAADEEQEATQSNEAQAAHAADAVLSAKAPLVENATLGGARKTIAGCPSGNGMQTVGRAWLEQSPERCDAVSGTAQQTAGVRCCQPGSAASERVPMKRYGACGDLAYS